MLLAAAFVAAPLVDGLALPALARAADEPITVSVSAGNGIARPGEDLTISATLTNPGNEPVAAGRIALSVSPAGLDRPTLESALDDPAAVPLTEVAAARTQELPAGGTAKVTIVLKSKDLGSALEFAGWGAHLLAAEVTAGGALLGTGESGFVWADGAPPSVVDVAAVLPLTTPSVTDGLLDADSLAAYTSPEGVLRRKLDAAAGRQVTLAIDPRILASIRALGTAAPPSAVLWLADLAAAPNPVFPLTYADSDISLEREAGAAAVLDPISFAGALDEANFSGTQAPAAEAAPSPATTGTPAPTPGPPAPGTLPSTEELLAWDYDLPGLAWPVRARPGDVKFVGASGYDRAIVPSDSVTQSGSGPTGKLEGERVLVSDSALSAAASAAAFSAGEAEAAQARADLGALLAASAGTAGTTVVVALDRGWPDSTSGLDPTLRALQSVPWAAAIPLDDVPDQDAKLTLRKAKGKDARAEAAGTLVQDDERIADFSTIVETPQMLTGRERLRLLALLSAQWLDFPDAWDTAARDLHRHYATDVLGAVTISSTNVNFVGVPDAVPIFVQNSLDLPVTVKLSARPSNGRILVSPATATVDAGASTRFSLPARFIANGRVDLQVTASSPETGKRIGSSVVIPLDVQAEWEAAGTTVVVGLVVVLFGFGLFRNIRRRRKAARPAVDES
ncbi:MAG: putative sortase-sorted surface-anchored protein [Naasia sp.]|nr:putative sortase-sorted surface-anchored protein [Naasia sp.]